ncbi:hypothetical protein C8J56DRAFT_1051253 [Mycena floridula]|nr:hypothetical protein C8J56DRAFT_1051253 [Mycena floridula]
MFASSFVDLRFTPEDRLMVTSSGVHTVVPSTRPVDNGPSAIPQASASAPTPGSSHPEPSASRPTIKSFAAGAKARKEVLQTKFENGPNKQPFEPALKIFEGINQNNRTTVPPRKKKTDLKAGPAPSKATTDAPVKLKTTEFTFILIPDTPSVQRGTFPMPTKSGLQLLHIAGFV